MQRSKEEGAKGGQEKRRGKGGKNSNNGKTKNHLQDDRSLLESSSQWKLTGGDVAVKDAILSPAPRRISRKTLDAQILACHSPNPPLYLKKLSTGDKQGSLTSLQRACLRVIVDNIGQEEILDQLAEGTFPERLLPHLARRVSAIGPEIPFHIYKRLAQTYQDLPLSFKTYYGIAFDDTEELQNLPRFDASFSFTPQVSIITFLDLSNTAFQKTDIFKIRVSCSGTLVALRLDNLQLDDNSITDLARGAGDGNAFIGLEILSFKGCSRISDRSASKFACYPALKMLDLSKTSCTSATKQILRQATRPPFLSAFTTSHLRLFRPTDLATTARALQRVSLASLHKPDDGSLPLLPEYTISPALLITELTRLDPNQVRDPRTLVPKNDFHASHHAFGNIWTTRPIDSNRVREDGGEQSNEGAAFRQGGHAAVMSGKLRMSQVDHGWKRKQAKKLGKVMSRTEEEEGYDDDSDLEDETVEEIKPEISTEPAVLPHQSTFYAPRPVVPAERPDPADILPEKDELMLLRFFKSGDESAERIVLPKRVIENDDTALRVSKKGKTVKGLDVLGELIAKPKLVRVESPASTGVTVQGSQRSQPAGIVRSSIGFNGGFGRKVVLR